jgi:hypothetical protein
LVQAIETLQSQGIRIQNMPEQLVELQASEQRLQSITEGLEQEMRGLDTNAIDLAIEMLDAEDEALIKYTQQMEKAGNLADERLQRITSIVNEYSAEESRYQRCLDATSNIETINIDTPQGARTLDKEHGRYRYRYWSQDYSSSQDLGWVDSLSTAYDRVGSTRRSELKKGLASKSSSITRVQLALKNRVESAREATLRGSNEKLRRERDREVHNLAKKHGLIVTRKKVGKKVQYALLRQR